MALQHKGQLKRIELALLLLLFVISLICFSPKKLDPLAAIAQMSAYHVTLALGFEYKNIYPNYSATAGQKLVNLAAQNSPAELFRIDLKKALPAELWETKNHFLYPLAGFEPGIVLAIRYLWHLTNNYSLGTIYWALKFLSLLGALAIFFLVATLRLPLLSLLAGTFFLFSPPLNDAIQFCSIYSFAPIVAALTTYLVFAACNNSEKKTLPYCSYLVGRFSKPVADRRWVDSFHNYLFVNSADDSNFDPMVKNASTIRITRVSDFSVVFFYFSYS